MDVNTLDHIEKRGLDSPLAISEAGIEKLSRQRNVTETAAFSLLIFAISCVTGLALWLLLDLLHRIFSLWL